MKNRVQCNVCRGWTHWVFIKSVEGVPVCVLCLQKHIEFEQKKIESAEAK